MRRIPVLVLAAAALAFLLSGVTAAYAAPAKWQSVVVRLHAEEGGDVMLVAGQLATATALPADVELSVPAGATYEWIGQILGGPIAQDPEIKYTKTVVGNVDVYHATLTQSRIAQVEVGVSGMLGTKGTTQEAALQWASAVDLPEVTLSVRIPIGAQIVQAATGASVEPADSQYSYYSTTIQNVKAGQKLDLTFTYTTGGAAAGGGLPVSGGQGSNTMIIFAVLAVIVGSAVLGGIIVAVRKSGRA